MKHYFILMRLHKPVGFLLPLWSALWALWIAAQGHPPLHTLIIFIIGAIVARSAGCIINDYMDRDIDCHVTRTQQRPLTTKIVSEKIALILFVILGLIALGLSALLNLYSFYIALLSCVFITLYPLMKRITYLPQVFLGFVFNIGILIAFTATQNQLPWIAFLLYGITILWTIAYDSMYALADRADDLKIGVKSSVILFGRKDRLIIDLLQSFVLIGLIGMGRLFHWNVLYNIACIATGIIMLYQHYLIRARKPSQCFAAFRISQHIGWIILLGLLAQRNFIL